SDKNILPEPEKSKITGIFIDDDQILIAATSNDTACVILSMNFDGSIDSTYKFNGGKGFSTFIKDGKGNIYAGGDIKGIYKFEIGAENWVRLPFGINKTFSLALDSADILYAGGIKQTGNTKYSAIYYSKNNGEDWSMYCSAFDSTSSENSDSLLHSINDIAASQTYIFAATDEGIYMAKSLEQIKIKQDDFIINHGFYLNQNYPNPFNPSTVISYDIPEASRVTLKVYDILGREVADLVNEFKEAGRYNVKFDASHLSTGIYIYQLRANDYVSVKKMSFVK
ncbi:MAG TPA: T9SS type A sorting domain-containing protein, partial [Ignavibacteriales bacterium]|nr:T9SS type A sorting domain-containing protein [Ignavibacteriales bacterium]